MIIISEAINSWNIALTSGTQESYEEAKNSLGIAANWCEENQKVLLAGRLRSMQVTCEQRIQWYKDLNLKLKDLSSEEKSAALSISYPPTYS